MKKLYAYLTAQVDRPSVVLGPLHSLALGPSLGPTQRSAWTAPQLGTWAVTDIDHIRKVSSETSPPLFRDKLFTVQRQAHKKDAQ